MFDLRRLRPRRPVHDGRQLADRRRGNDQLEQKPVHLRFRQGVRPLHLDGVLGGKNEKRLLQLVGVAGDGDAVFLHRLQHRRLRLGRGAVDLVGQHDVGEDRAGLELEDLAARGVLHQDVGAGDVGGHQVRRELDAGERQIQHLRERPHQQGLAEAGDAFQQRVAARQQADQHPVHDVRVPDDDLADLGPHPVEVVLELRDGLFIDFDWHRVP